MPYSRYKKNQRQPTRERACNNEIFNPQNENDLQPKAEKVLGKEKIMQIEMKF